MVIKEPLLDLNIEIEKFGFYQGFSKFVTVGSKISIGALILWAMKRSETAGEVLKAVRSSIDNNTGPWYMYVMAFYILVCFGLAIWPANDKIRRGGDGSRPEFSSFSWFSMMFGAGIGIGMLTYATGEPIYHFSNNPVVIMENTTASSAVNVRAAMKWSFLHWGVSAWGCYAIVGLTLAFFSYSRGLPLTIRSGLTPLFGHALEGPLGHIVDIVSVIATLLVVSLTLGYGVSQFASGVYKIIGMNWLMDVDGDPTKIAMIVSLVIVIIASTLSALSGVDKGIKWLSSITMGLSFFMLAFFLVVGSTLFALSALICRFVGLCDKLADDDPHRMVCGWYWRYEHSQCVGRLAGWRDNLLLGVVNRLCAVCRFVSGPYFKGTHNWGYVLSAMIVPSIMCFVWFAFAGCTAIDLTLNGGAGDQFTGAGLSSQLFPMINFMLSSTLATLMSFLIVILLSIYLVTSADSAVLIIYTIAAAGDESPKGRVHIITWGIILTLVIAGLLLTKGDGLAALNTEMIIGALPFSVVMALMGIALVKALVWDGMHNAAGIAKIVEPAE